MSNIRNHLPPLCISCFCTDSRPALTEEADGKLARLIQKGNLPAIERALKRLKQPLNNLTITVKRRHLNTTYQCLVDHRATGTDPFINFYQECSPVIWAVDCLQWHVLPLLSRYGFDVNRPQTCRRWTHICAPNSRSNTSPYRKFWTRGRYTYQSALDYFFASVYELIGEHNTTNYNGLNGSSPLTFYFSHLSTILTKGVDVHRIDSVIIFNSLAISFDHYLCRYTNEHALVPDIPENDDSFIELITVKRLIENGFSQFECMDYLYPCCNWFGILLCLICHPKIYLYQSTTLPTIIKQSTLLLINLLALKCTFPSVEDFRESLENLHLRKIYSKRYSERRNEFNTHLTILHELCENFIHQPLNLKILARNIVRKQIGGINFYMKIINIGLPSQLITFIQYINHEHLLTCGIPKQLIKLAQGNWVDILKNNTYSRSHSTIYCNNDEFMNTLNRNSCLEQIINNNNNNHCDEEFKIHTTLRRGRASERQHLTYQRGIHNQIFNRINHYENYNQPIRPTSAPLPKTFIL
ncbi:hypothetical protein MN116_000707 [Schistosoma mekongi]|uniref:SOCS box domain-containing protein n=1 Tax=Schistosoma mekongi TaxID=38744 RepID=A0AAE2D7Y4_SCHME|nr:hypothetical protein MN116_000707 [Schistosoma mekongi]